MVEAAGIGEPIEPGPDAADPVSVTIRAAVLRYLLVAGEWKVAAQGVRLRDLRITGRLDLEGAEVQCPLRLKNCYLDSGEPVNLDYADVSAVFFIGCKLPGLSGKTLKVGKDLNLNGSTLTGPLQLQVAAITGDLDCTGVRLEGIGDALSAAAMKVSGNVFLTETVTTAGGIDLESANIDGTLKCSGALLQGAVERYGGSYALFAQWIKVGGPVRLNMNFTATHTVFLLGADISANLNCRDARLYGTGQALDAERMKLGGNMLAERVLTTAARINLLGADIVGNLKCVDAWLNGAACAVYGERLKVHGDVFFGTTKRLSDAAEAIRPPDAEPKNQRMPYGWIWLSDAEIDGNLNFTNALLNGANSLNGVDYSLYGERLNVHSDVLFNSVSSPNGAIWLRSANIKGKLLWAPGEQLHQQVNLADATAGRPKTTGRTPTDAGRLTACSTWRVSPTVASAEITRPAWKSAWDGFAASGPTTARSASGPSCCRTSATRARQAARGDLPPSLTSSWQLCISRPGRITKPTKWSSSGAGMCAGTETSRVTAKPLTCCWIRPFSTAIKPGGRC